MTVPRRFSKYICQKNSNNEPGKRACETPDGEFYDAIIVWPFLFQDRGSDLLDLPGRYSA